MSCVNTQEEDEEEMSEQESDRPWSREEGRAACRLPPSSPQRPPGGDGELSGGLEVKRERRDASQTVTTKVWIQAVEEQG